MRMNTLPAIYLGRMRWNRPGIDGTDWLSINVFKGVYEPGVSRYFRVTATNEVINCLW